MTNALKHFKHIFVDRGAPRTLFLLHGTGGSERDLLPLVEPLRDEYNFVGLLGNVKEDGMARFFRRSKAGVFDQESIRTEAEKLSQFVRTWCTEKSIDRADTAFLGYSNGANMILATAMLYPSEIDQAVLLHPMLPFEMDGAKLLGKMFLVTYGTQDLMIPAEESEKVVSALKEARADVEVVKHEGGHEIQPAELEAVERFLRE